MLAIIAQIVLCIIAATVLGFVIGWIFSSFVRNEKHQSQILAVKERFDLQKGQINQLETDLKAKNRELLIIKEEFTSMQKEILSYDMDQDEYKDKNREDSELLALKSENQMLLGQIKEQKICEDENDLLRVELKELEDEKQTLLDKIEELEEYKIGYKKNIAKIAELESIQKKTENSSKAKQSINDTICGDKEIITDKDLIKNGLKDDNISDVIKALFTDQDKKDLN